MAALKEAVDRGFTSVEDVIVDNDLVPIFQEQGFRRLLEDLQERKKTTEARKAQRGS